MQGNRTGFTIIEVTVVLAIASALFAVVLPRALRFVDTIEVRGAVTELESLFSLARHVAIARGQQAVLEIDQGNRRVSVRAGPDIIRIREIGAAHGVEISSNRPSITYSPIGIGYGAGNLTMTVTRNSAADTIVVSRLGRVRH